MLIVGVGLGDLLGRELLRRFQALEYLALQRLQADEFIEHRLALGAERDGVLVLPVVIEALVEADLAAEELAGSTAERRPRDLRRGGADLAGLCLAALDHAVDDRGVGGEVLGELVEAILHFVNEGRGDLARLDARRRRCRRSLLAAGALGELALQRLAEQVFVVGDAAAGEHVADGVDDLANAIEQTANRTVQPHRLAGRFHPLVARKGDGRHFVIGQ